MSVWGRRIFFMAVQSFFLLMQWKVLSLLLAPGAGYQKRRVGRVEEGEEGEGGE
jgi:hypothetical protein